MKQTYAVNLKPGQPVETTFLVQTKERKIARNGKPYLDLELKDSTGMIRAKLWDCDRFPQDFEVDDVVSVTGQVEEFQGNVQLRVGTIARRADAVDLLDYLPRTAADPEQMYATLLTRVRELGDGPLAQLLRAVLEDPVIAEKYKRAPAAMSYHHAYLGGLLEHVSSLVQLGDRLCDQYSMLRRDLLLAGLILHDLGKIEELTFSRGFRYTTRGQLLGHMTIALEILGEKMRSLPDFPAALKDQLEHIIISHHGQLEFGSPKEPMFPEALVVHYLDDLDSKLASMRATYAAHKNHPGDWTARNPALRRELLIFDSAAGPSDDYEPDPT
jgi:3'-5' exoribonuclease